ncbi:MAG: hypothetical protein ACTSRE_06825 [Promethearchaeota archaeon]
MEDTESLKRKIIEFLATFTPAMVQRGDLLRIAPDKIGIDKETFIKLLDSLIAEFSVEYIEYDPTSKQYAVIKLTESGMKKYKINAELNYQYISRERKDTGNFVEIKDGAYGSTIKTLTPMKKKDLPKALLMSCGGIICGAVIVALLIIFL